MHTQSNRAEGKRCVIYLGSVELGGIAGIVCEDKPMAPPTCASRLVNTNFERGGFFFPFASDGPLRCSDFVLDACFFTFICDSLIIDFKDRGILVFLIVVVIRISNKGRCFTAELHSPFLRGAAQAQATMQKFINADTCKATRLGR